MRGFTALATFLLAIPAIMATHLRQTVANQSTKHLHELRVVPIPTQYTTGKDVICLAPDFSIQYEEPSATKRFPKDLLEAIERAERRLWTNRHQYLSIKRGIEHFESKDGGVVCKHQLKTLTIVLEHEGDGEIKTIMHSSIRPAEERPELERYTLSVPLSSSATLKSHTALGILRGLTTFEQLFYHLPNRGSRDSAPNLEMDGLTKANQVPFNSHDKTYERETNIGARSGRDGLLYAPAGPYEIEDKPAFGWRAVMLDTSRNFFSKGAIFKVTLSHACHRGCILMM